MSGLHLNYSSTKLDAPGQILIKILINEFLNIYLFICIEDNCKLTVRLSYVPDVAYGSPWTAN